VINEPFLKEVEAKGNYLVTQLEKELKDISIVKEIRGKGLMVGIECSEEVLPFIKKLLNKGVLVLSAGKHVLRLLPPLIVTYEEINKKEKKIKHAISRNKETRYLHMSESKLGSKLNKQFKGKIFLKISDYTKENLTDLVNYSIELKKMQKDGVAHELLKGKTLAMIFEKSSIRTRVSFETG